MKFFQFWVEWYGTLSVPEKMLLTLPALLYIILFWTIYNGGPIEMLSRWMEKP